MSDEITNYFIFRDSRLKGNLPFVATALITSHLDETTPLANAFSRIKVAASIRGKIKTLFILCHGNGSGMGNRSDFWWHGGRGLQLGKEGVRLGNVSTWAAIKDCVENIVVYACGAAYTGPSSWTNLQVNNDGRSLMASLAKYTNAIVFAADQIQWYSPGNFNFGKWEGTVYMFFPTGLIVSNFNPPIEVIDVISPLPEPNHYSLSYLHYLKLKQARNL